MIEFLTCAINKAFGERGFRRGRPSDHRRSVWNERRSIHFDHSTAVSSTIDCWASRVRRRRKTRRSFAADRWTGWERFSLLSSCLSTRRESFVLMKKKVLSCIFSPSLSLSLHRTRQTSVKKKSKKESISEGERERRDSINVFVPENVRWTREQPRCLSFAFLFQPQSTTSRSNRTSSFFFFFVSIVDVWST